MTKIVKMSLLAYFCIPLVVTGQIVGSQLQLEDSTDNESPVRNPETSETGLYSQYEYGSQVGYRNEIDEFAVGQNGDYYRKRPGAESEDSGSVGTPNIYASDNGNNDHPSFVTSNIYNFIRDKKNNNSGNNKDSQTKNQPQVPSPLAYGAPAVPVDEQSAIVIDGQTHDRLRGYAVSPVHDNHIPIGPQGPLVPLVHPSVLLQHPQTGQLLHAPVHHNGLVPLYQSPVAPPYAYVNDGGVLAQPIQVGQKLVPVSSLQASGIPHHHQYSLIRNAPVQEQVLLKPVSAPVYNVPLLNTDINAAYHAQHHAKHPISLGGPLHKYQSHLLKSPELPVHQTQKALFYQDHVHKPHHGPNHLHQTVLTPYHSPVLNSAYTNGQVPLQQVPLYRTEEVPTLLKSPLAPLYHQSHAPYIKAAAGPLILKSQVAQLYQTPLVHANLQNHVLIQDPTVPIYKQPVLNDAAALSLLKASGHHHDPSLKIAAPVYHQHVLKYPPGAPLLKSPNLDATIYPAIEETLPGVPLNANGQIVKQPVLTQHLTHNSPGSDFFVQKAVLEKSPVLTEKAVLRAALSPVRSSAEQYVQTGGIIKAPLLRQFEQHGYLEERELPARILSSQKSLVNSIIASDERNVKGGKVPKLLAGGLELVPSLSYGYSYSLYPNRSGDYNPPQDLHRHH